jgi:hypothetical protein
MKYILYVFLISKSLYSQTKYYNINLFDGKDYMLTMNQSNDLMLNSVRLIGNEINVSTLNKKEKKVYYLSSLLFTSLLGQAITHEEGHRSVLTNLGIGSVSKPIFDKNFVAKVTGVENKVLMNLRDNDFQNFIRLHTAGLESDYSYLSKTDALFNYNEEEYNILYPDYVARKFGVAMYFLTNLIPSKLNIKEADEPNEMKRDVVGHDLYGMIRHLHRPNMNFYRYTEWEDLTSEEKSYAKRMGFLSLLNFLNPNLYLIRDIKITDNTLFNFSVNYSLTPFGDFTEQQAYFNIKNKYKINTYFRQYYNKSNTFFATGVKLNNFVFNKNKCILNSNIDIWNQPKNLEFDTKKSEFGLGLSSVLGYRISKINEKSNSIYLNCGLIYKTKGFIPEAPSLNDDFRFIFGLTFSKK